jgi:hypothetical protein
MNTRSTVGGYLGMKEIYKIIKSKFCGQKMKKELEAYINKRNSCQVNNC